MIRTKKAPWRNDRRGDAMAFKWFRVLYRPCGTSGAWTYGWQFPSDSLLHANETLDRTCGLKDRNRWTYRVEEVDPRDFDHPEEEDSSMNASMGIPATP
ncbi:MAG: hypothetical protein ABFD90_21140 [Phycisphaerales bacterium]